MNTILALELYGLSDLPKSKKGVLKWLQRLAVPVTRVGQTFTFALSDLPTEVCLAYVTRKIEAAGLPVGTCDEAAHDAFADMPPKMRAEAERKAAVARLLMTAGKLLSWPEKIALAASALGRRGASDASSRRVSGDIEGVDPIHFAPALLADHHVGRKPTEISTEAWSCFLTALREADEGYPLRSAGRDGRDLAPAQGWRWPSWPTAYAAGMR